MKLILKALGIYIATTLALSYFVISFLNYFIGDVKTLWLPIIAGIACIQWILWNFFNRYVESKSTKNQVSTIEIAQVVEKMFDQYGTSIECAYCKKQVFVPIRVGTDNSFECPSCEEENAVYITVETAQKTRFANDLLPDNTKGTITEASINSDAGKNTNR